MIVQVYADKSLVYDNRLEGYELLGLTVQAKAESGGAATIQMPYTHPAYNRFVSLKTLVEIYRDNELVFRGRALYPSDNFYGSRTITCESERCFFQDAVMRPYLYQTTPQVIFADIVRIYNEQVDEFKRFSVGTITVTDDNDYIRLEGGDAATVADVINKLVDRCGGYIVFSTGDNGERVINWYAELTRYSTQAIELGENLLDFTRDDGNTENLATVLVPYGAKDEETGERVTIASVNNGLDYIQADDAIEYRGRIVKTVTWDDVTVPANLLRKAIAYLGTAKLITTQLSLSAVDLSAMDQDIDTFSVGDQVRVISKAHNIDADYLLMERTYDLLNPANDTVSLGKTVATLTGSATAGDRTYTDALNKVEQDVRADYEKNKELISNTETELKSLIQQNSSRITLEVAQREEDSAGIKESIAAIQESASKVEIRITQIEQNGVDKVKTSMGYTFDDSGLTISKDGEQIKNTLDHKGMTVKRGDEIMLSADKDGVIATDVKVRNYLIIGEHARVEDYTNGSDSKRTAVFWISS